MSYIFRKALWLQSYNCVESLGFKRTSHGEASFLDEFIHDFNHLFHFIRVFQLLLGHVVQLLDKHGALEMVAVGNLLVILIFECLLDECEFVER
jgi:hypothetical protein